MQMFVGHYAAGLALKKIDRYGMGFFVVILLLINAINIFGPPFGDTKV